MAKQINQIVTSTDTFQTWVDINNQIVDFCNTEVVSVNAAGGLTTGDGFVNGQFGANIMSTAILRGGNNTANSVLTIETNTYFNSVKINVGNSTVNSTINSIAYTFANSTSTANLGLGGFSFGNVDANTTALIVGANVYINATGYFVGNGTVNTFIDSSTIKLTSGAYTTFSVNTVGLPVQVVDSFISTSYRGGQYTITVKDGTVGANAHQISQLLIAHVTDTAYVTEYGIITTNTSVGTLGVFSATTNATHVILNFTPSVANTVIKGSRTLITV